MNFGAPQWQQQIALAYLLQPGWINYVETFYPEFLDNVSSCKSPQQMFGAVIKTYYAKIQY